MAVQGGLGEDTGMSPAMAPCVIHPLCPRAAVGTWQSGVGCGKRAAPLLQNITWVRLVQQALLMRSIILLQKKGGPPAPTSLCGEHSAGGVPGPGTVEEMG